MKKILLLLPLLTFVGCGYSSRDNEMIGQVKRVIKRTPILCSPRVDIDLTLGVMRNGTGSMSTQDEDLTVANEADVALLKEASESGALVRLHYDVKRLVFCWNDHIITKVELLKGN